MAGMGGLPFDVTSTLVASLHASLPSHQALLALASLRGVNRHWRGAVEDSLLHWRVPPHVLTAAAAGQLAILLRRFRNLHSLVMDWDEAEEAQDPAHRLGAATLAALSSLRRLHTLSLIGCQPTSALCSAVATLSSLSCFSFAPSTEGSTEASLAPLAACTALTSLQLRSLQTTDVAPSVVPVLRGATRLQQLSLYRSVRATAAQAQQAFAIGFATQLTCLELQCTFTGDEAFTELFAQLTHLRRINLSGSPNLTDDGLRGITCLSASLTALVLQGGHQVTADGATALAHLTNLRCLDLGFSNRMSGDYLLPLLAGALSQLTMLDIRGCPSACSPTAFPHLSRLLRLRHLSAQGCRLWPGAVHILARMPHLLHLELADNPALGEMDVLTSLRALRLLDVSECGLQDAHLVPLLSHLPQARTLLLNSNRALTSAVVEALAAGPARTCLQVLGLTEVKLDGEAVGKLLPQLSALCELDVSAAVCVTGSLAADGGALLAVAEGMPALHTLTARGLRPPSGWQEVVQAGAGSPRRRLLRVVA